MGNLPRQVSVRARTPLDVLVMGRNVFTQVSKSLTPLRNALFDALKRGDSDMLQEERPEAYEVLRHTPLTEFIEPVPQPLLKPTDTLKEALTLFSGYSNEFFYVSSDGLQLNGLLTMTDLLRTLESGAEMDMPVTEFMIKDPVTVSVNDTGLVAALTLRDYRLKWVPVVDPEQGRRIAGYISARKIMAYVLKETRIFS